MNEQRFKPLTHELILQRNSRKLIHKCTRNHALLTSLLTVHRYFVTLQTTEIDAKSLKRRPRMQTNRTLITASASKSYHYRL